MCRSRAKKPRSLCAMSAAMPWISSKPRKKLAELTEDDQKNLEEEVQKLTDKFVKEIDATCARKNQEIMEV